MGDGSVLNLNYSDSPWQRLYFLPEPQGQGAFRDIPEFAAAFSVVPVSEGAL